MKYLKSLNTGSISSSGSKELSWTPDTRIVIKKIMISERSASALNNVQAFISIAAVPYTKDYVPASAIGSNPQYCYMPDAVVDKGAEIYVKLTNSTGSAVNCDIVFEVETA